MKSKASVGLFGYYDEGNFGDDLMAVMIGRHLMSLGVDFTLWGNPQLFLRCHGFSTTHSIRELVDQSGIVVVGGGGILVPSLGPRQNFDRCLEELLARCREKKVPLYAISVGGTGAALSDITPPERHRMLAQASHVTVRNREDLDAVRAAGTSVEFHHDIVWAVPRFFGSTGRQAIRRRIGINLYPGNRHTVLFRIFATAMRKIVRSRQDLEFIFIDSHSGGLGHQAWCPADGGANCSNRKFGQMDADIEFLQELDLLVTCKLHLAVAGMSYGIKCISFLGRAKTALLYQNLGLVDLLWGSKGYLKLPYILSSRRRTDQLLASRMPFDPEPLQEDAVNHFRRLTEILRGHGLVERR